MSASEAVSRVFLRHQFMLMDYVRGLVRDPHDADDLFQEVGVKILAKSSVPQGDAAFAAWARGVARNTVLHHWRAKRRRRVIPSSRLLDVVDRAYQEADAGADEMTDRRRVLEDCIRGVPEKTRKILKMRYCEGLKSATIAERLRSTATAVRMTISRVRRELFGCVEKRLAGEGQR
jgi:RNA polymerase sigma-70 factor (ECF subfamily)